ncbi:MAG: hypothetical protein NUV52_03490 [Candidatus Roizmanbacteria bacterium]|nr:hypothetical protein [Candidatus Roizmanbacteria bacterium]
MSEKKFLSILESLQTRSIIAWFLFIPIAILNGIAREFVYKPMVGDLIAHQISTAIACIAFFLLAYSMIKKQAVGASSRRLVLVGVLWVLMTILFEFSFGHYVDGVSWERLLADYNIFQGRVWGVFLLLVLLTPLLAKRKGK